MKKNKNACKKCGKITDARHEVTGYCIKCSGVDFKERLEVHKSAVIARHERYIKAKINGTLKYKWEYYRFQFFDTRPQGKSLNTVFFGVSRFYFNQTEKEYRIHLFRYMARFYFRRVEKYKYI